MTYDDHDVVVEELPLLLTGELDRDQTMAVLRHLRACPTCRAELAEAAAVHATLTSARRTLEPREWQRGQVEQVGPVEQLPELSVLPELPVLPELSAVRGTSRRRVLTGVAAAVVALGIALGAVGVTGHWPGSRHGAPVATESVRLAPVVSTSGTAAAPDAAGVVSMSGPGPRTHMTITTHGLPQAAAGHFYYAWLLDPATNKMLPLGVVEAGATASFVVDSTLVARYSALDISLQADNGNPVHSPVSVLRASYAA
jgi:hypothetical protein